MSASIREPEQGPSKDEPLKYAPKKVREAEPGAAPAGPPEPAAPPGGAAPERASSEHAEPPWRRSRPRSGGTAFAGDIAIAELRTKLALAPDRLPEPPPPSTAGSKLAWAGRVTGIAVVATVGFLGYRWGSTPHALPQHAAQARQPATERSVPVIGQDNAIGGPIGGSTIPNPTATVYHPQASATRAGPFGGRAFRQLTVGQVPAQQTDETARLAVSAIDAGANAAVVIGGLAPGSALSAGREVSPTTWRVPVEEVPGLSITPPRGFVGSMDLTVELRAADNSVADRKAFQVEWLSRTPPGRTQARQHDPAEIAQIVKKGAELMANGDVAAARLMYQRAAEAGEAAAAFALAETYDPQVLAKGGIPPDIGLAQQWYTKARELGSPQASDRLDRLARSAE